MIRQFTLNLDDKHQKPVIQLEYINVLLDTGADFPIWTDEKQVLIDMFGAKLVKRNVSFKGFGGDARGDIYRIECFTLGELTYAGLDVMICDGYKNAAFYMILSATMFRNLIYQIDDKNHKLNIDIPNGENPIRNLIIQDSNGRAYVLCSGIQEEEYAL